LFLSAGIGSLAGNLIAGESFKDSLKAAALTAVTAGITQGFDTTSGEATAGFKTKFNDFFGSASSASSAGSAGSAAQGAGIGVGDILNEGINTPISNEILGTATNFDLPDLGSELDIGLNTATSTGAGVPNSLIASTNIPAGAVPEINVGLAGELDIGTRAPFSPATQNLFQDHLL